MNGKYSRALGIKTKTVDEKCPIHNINLIQMVSGQAQIKPFCPQCQLENNQKELHSLEKSVIDNSYKGYIKRFSLVDRLEVFNYTFENFKTSSNSEMLVKQTSRAITKQYFEDKNKKFNTLLFGNAGSGKTHLAMSMLNAVNQYADPMQKCLFLSITKLMREMKIWFSEKNNNWSPNFVRKVVHDADLVVIDDLGAETANTSASNFVQDTIFEIYESNQRIITTSNLSMQELESKYHGRLISRILEGSKGHLINFENVSDKRKAGVS